MGIHTFSTGSGVPRNSPPCGIRREALAFVSGMKRLTILILVLSALPLIAQQPASKPADKIVASINGEVITQSHLDELYDSLNLQMRQQYERAGGKGAFLDNYMRKRRSGERKRDVRPLHPRGRIPADRHG